MRRTGQTGHGLSTLLAPLHPILKCVLELHPTKRANLRERNRSCFKQADELLAGDIQETGLLCRHLAIVDDELHPATDLKLDQDIF